MGPAGIRRASSARAPRNGRNGAIDALKFLSIFGIVWFHARAPGMNIGYSGLVIFLTLTAYHLPGKIADSAYLKKRMLFLLYPWLGWSLFYGVLNVARSEEFLGAGDGPLMLKILTGPMIHLWYLPFVMAATAAFSGLIRFSPARNGGVASTDWMCSARASTAFAAAAAASIGACFFLRVSWGREFPVPLPQWIHAFPSLPIGLLFWSIRRRSPPVKAAASLVLSAFFLMAVRAGDHGFGIPYLVGLNAAHICIHIKDLKLPFSEMLGGLTLGIYLIHLFVFMVIQKAGLIGANPALFAAVSFFVSAVIIYAIKRLDFPWISRLV